MRGLRVLKPGALTTVQDGGRWGFQRFGVPVSGPMDPEAHGAANGLVGNPRDAAALEMTVVGGTFQAESRLVVAACGAPMHPTLDGVPVAMGRAFEMAEGQTLRFGAVSAGARAYLAVAGGIEVPPVMGSASTYLRGGFGGYQGRALRAGDRLAVGEPVGAVQEGQIEAAYGKHAVLRVVPGPEADRFSEDALAAFFGTTLTVTPQADRTGYRLGGGAIAGEVPGDLLSEPVPMGTLQVPADGQPILLMADRQPTGGYARVAIVVTADLPLAGQLLPGHTAQFTLVSLR